ncbi:hypothetical protein D6783_01685 [Candidatus Woesearchaeota archaeon]|nr:MAG: hypothetical protein D6783_01685 [Candidatus Woesearchaeota archaeon]
MERGEHPVQSQLELKRSVRKKIQNLLEKGHVTEEEVYRLFKYFFQEFLQKRYEFTAAELREELEKVYLTNDVRNQVLSFLELMESFEVGSEEFSVDALKRSLREFEKVVDVLVGEEEERVSFLKRLLRFKWKKRESSSLDDAVDENARQLEERLKVLREKIRLADEAEAKRLYKELIGYYEQASEERRKRLYPELAEAYRRIRAL